MPSGVQVQLNGTASTLQRHTADIAAIRNESADASTTSSEINLIKSQLTDLGAKSVPWAHHNGTLEEVFVRLEALEKRREDADRILATTTEDIQQIKQTQEAQRVRLESLEDEMTKVTMLETKQAALETRLAAVESATNNLAACSEQLQFSTADGCQAEHPVLATDTELCTAGSPLALFWSDARLEICVDGDLKPLKPARLVPGFDQVEGEDLSSDGW